MVSECSVRILVSATFVAIMTMLQVPRGDCAVIGEATKDAKKATQEAGPLLNKLKGSMFLSKSRSPEAFEKSERNSSSEVTKNSMISNSKKIKFPVQLKNESTAALALKPSATLKRRSLQETQCSELGVSDSDSACKEHCGGSNYAYSSGSSCDCFTTSNGEDCVYASTSDSSDSTAYASGTMTVKEYSDDSCTSGEKTNTYTLNECEESDGGYYIGKCDDNNFAIQAYTDSTCSVESSSGLYLVYGSVNVCHKLADLDDEYTGSVHVTCTSGGMGSNPLVFLSILMAILPLSLRL